MNNLSWFLYWANVAPHLSSWVIVISMLFCVAGGYGCIIYFFLREETREKRHWETTDDPLFKYTDTARKVQSLKFCLWFTPLMLFVSGCACLVPSKDTFYLIAASEIGGDATKTPEFLKVKKVVNKFLDEQLVDKSKK